MPIDYYQTFGAFRRSAKTMHGKRVRVKNFNRREGIPVTKPSYAYLVTCWPLPHHLRPHVVKGLAADVDQLWLRSRDACAARRWAQAERIHFDAIRFEVRECEVCHRLLLGDYARERRMQVESMAEGKELPCSADCLDARSAWERKKGKRIA